MEPSSLHVNDVSRIAETRGALTGLLAHSPSALTIFDLDGRCVLVNSAYREIFGSEPAPDYDLLSDEQLEPGFRERVKRAYAGEEARLPAAWYAPDELRRLSVRSERRAGIAVSIFPLREADSRVAYIAIGFEDARAGYAACEPFGDYRPDPHSVFMRKDKPA